MPGSNLVENHPARQEKVSSSIFNWVVKADMSFSQFTMQEVDLRAEICTPEELRLHPNWTGGTVIRSIDWFKKHPAYVELKLFVSPTQLAALKSLGDLAFKDPLLVTCQGVIIDGYARKEYADRSGISTLPCVEFDIGEEEALRMILNKHRRSAGWNDYNRIRMACWQCRDDVRARARANQQAGGRFKGLSKLTEANVRKEIAKDAGACEGNVRKVDEVCDADPEVLNALANSELRINRAWLWRKLTREEQREELRLHQLNRGLKGPAKARAVKHRATGLLEVAWPHLGASILEEISQKISLISSTESETPEKIAIGVVKMRGKAILLTTELYENLVAAKSRK
jgi:hypothetical protein